MLIPTLSNEVPGDFLTAALWNGTVIGGLTAAQNPVMFKGYATTAQSLTSGTSSVPFLLDTEDFDTDGGHSTTTNTSRYVCQTAGVFMCWGSWTTATASATGTRACEVTKNGGQIPGAINQSSAPAGNGATTAAVNTLVRLAVGDYVELAGWQTSGGPLTTTAGTSSHTWTTFNVVRISN